MKADKINMIINFSILALLIYLAVAVKSLQKQVSWAPTIIKPMGMNSEMSHDIQTLLNNVLKEAINNQQGEQ